MMAVATMVSSLVAIFPISQATNQLICLRFLRLDGQFLTSPVRSAKRYSEKKHLHHASVFFSAIRKSWLKRDQSSPASIMRMSVEMSAP